MEKLLLCPFLACDELDVVDEQDVDVPVLVAEFLVPVVLDGVDELVREFLRRRVENLRVRVLVEDVVADGMHQMRLAQTDAAIDEQGIVCQGRCFRNGQGGGMGKLVSAALDVGFKGILGIEDGRPGWRVFRFHLLLRGSFAGLDHQLDVQHAVRDDLDSIADQLAVARIDDAMLNSVGASNNRTFFSKDTGRMGSIQVLKLTPGISSRISFTDSSQRPLTSTDDMQTPPKIALIPCNRKRNFGRTRGRWPEAQTAAG